MPSIDRTDPDRSLERILHALAAPRRREMLLVLRDSTGPVTVTDLAARLADTTTSDPDATVVGRRHLPLLVDSGLVAYGPEADRVVLAAPAWALDLLDAVDRIQGRLDGGGPTG
jgi:DNA-binding transcriptional ArsR family regulator